MVSFGFFVELENTIEGLVRIDTLYDDYYVYEEEAYRFIGSNGRKVYALGDPVFIAVDSVNQRSERNQLHSQRSGFQRRSE